jgi:AMP-binding enzyme
MRTYFRNYFATAEVDLDTGDLLRDQETGFGKRTSLDVGGEVIVQVPDVSLFPGYWKNKNATDKKFIRNLFKKGDLWYRTGDALRRTPDGLWFFMDRYVPMILCIPATNTMKKIGRYVPLEIRERGNHGGCANLRTLPWCQRSGCVWS